MTSPLTHGNHSTVRALLAALFLVAINPSGAIALSFTGNLYVGNFNDGTIDRIDPSGVTAGFASGLSQPEGLAVDSLGNLYAAESGSGAITKFTPSGVSSIFLPSG